MIMALGEEPVKGMAELMENGLDLIDCQVIFKICHIHDDWTYFFAICIEILLADIAHPRSPALAGARHIVSGKDSEQRTVRSCHLVCRHLWVIYRNSVNLLYVHAIQGICGEEHAFDDIVKLEIRLGGCLFKVIFGLAHFLRILPPVPRLY